MKINERPGNERPGAPDQADSLITDGDDADAPELGTPPERPRVRWAGIVWGLAFLVIAVLGARLALSPDASGFVGEMITTATVSTLTATGLLALGAVLLLSGIVGQLRGVQRHTR